MKEVAVSLMAWLCTHVGLPVTVDVPEHRIVSHKELKGIYCGDGRRCPDSLKAVYVHREKMVYLPHGFNVKEKEDQSTLVHEFVHHLQSVFNSPVPPCFNEAEAYYIEDHWRKENGLVTNTDKVAFRLWLGNCVMDIIGGVK